MMKPYRSCAVSSSSDTQPKTSSDCEDDDYVYYLAKSAFDTSNGVFTRMARISRAHVDVLHRGKQGLVTYSVVSGAMCQEFLELHDFVMKLEDNMLGGGVSEICKKYFDMGRRVDHDGW
jgi:hypothetical protein